MTVAKPGNPHGKENEPLVGTVSFKIDGPQRGTEAWRRLSAAQRDQLIADRWSRMSLEEREIDSIKYGIECCEGRLDSVLTVDVEKYGLHAFVDKIRNTPAVVYVLKNPATGQVHYVGRTRHDLRIRLNNHLSVAKYKGNNEERVASWIRDLIRSGSRPSIEPVENTTLGEALKAERRWIIHYRAAGEPITNRTYYL